MAKENLIGQTFAEKFKITGFLGEGGMGRIYLATELGADRQVALKVLHVHLGGEDEVVQRFGREMIAAESVQHPNSVRVYEHGSYKGRLFLSMEFVDGDTLGEVLLDDAPFAPQRVAKIARQVAAALGAAHSIGIIHRDLKPDNVMIDGPGVTDTVKVCDFGLARFVGGADDQFGDDSSSFKTGIGVRVGTPHYMSPEYVSSFTSDHRADLYALGILMYEMSTGAPPFDGKAYEVLDHHVRTKPAPPSMLNPVVPPWLDEVILKLLEKKPADRYQVAEEVLVKLERDRGEVLDDDATAESPTAEAPAPLPMNVEVTRTEEMPVRTEDLPTTPKSNPLVIGGMVFVAAVLGAGALFALVLIAASGAFYLGIM